MYIIIVGSRWRVFQNDLLICEPRSKLIKITTFDEFLQRHLGTDHLTSMGGGVAMFFFLKINSDSQCC